MAYTVKKISVKDFDARVSRFIHTGLTELQELQQRKGSVDNIPIKHIIDKHLVLVCFRGEEPVGFMIGVLGPTNLDMTLTVLNQLVLYAKYPKASSLLISNFIDFGKRNANYVAMCIGKFTNIKESSLEKLGFKKGDMQFVMET